MNYLIFEVGPAMIERFRPLAPDVRHEGAPEGHVEDLVAPADGQQRLALAEHFVDEQQLEQIPLRRGAWTVFSIREAIWPNRGSAASSPPVSITPSERRTASATNSRSGTHGSSQGRPAAARIAGRSSSTD